MVKSKFTQLIEDAEKHLQDELEKGLEIARQIQEELERDPLDDIFFFSTLRP